MYETFDGWEAPTSGAHSIGDLPDKARAYVDALGALTGTRVRIVSVGARRDQTLFC